MDDFLALGIDKNIPADENFIKLLEKKNNGNPLTDEQKEAAKNIDPFTRFIFSALLMEDN